MGPRIVVQENDAFTAHLAPFFGSTSETYSAFHNKPLTLLWSLVPGILSTKFPYGPRKCTSQLGGNGVDSVHVCPCFISNHSYTTQRKCMRVGVQE